MLHTIPTQRAAIVHFTDSLVGGSRRTQRTHFLQCDLASAFLEMFALQLHFTGTELTAVVGVSQLELDECLNRKSSQFDKRVRASRPRPGTHLCHVIRAGGHFSGKSGNQQDRSLENSKGEGATRRTHVSLR
jgi:hypothetical protein